MRRAPALVLALAALASGAAAPATGQTGARFDRLGTEDGLSQSVVNAVVQDRQGYLWFGTEDGLNRYDGVRFVAYRYVPDDSTALPSSRVTALAEDGAGALWVGTTAGLARLDRARETFSRPPGAPGDPSGGCGSDVTALASGADGTLYAATRNGGLCAAAPGGWETVPVRGAAPGAMEPGALALFRGARGALWAHVTGVGARGAAGVCRVDERARTCEVRPEIPWTRSVPGASGVGFADEPGGLAMYRDDGDGWRLAASFPGVRMAGGSRALLATGGRVWIGTDDRGILDVDPETGEARFHAPDPADPRSLGAAGVRALYRDAQGTVWIGTARGLSRWRPPGTGAFQTLTAGPGGLSAPGVNGVHQARDGRVYIATNDGLNRLDPETGAVEVFRREGAAGESFPSAFWWVYEAADGTVWVGAKRQGLFTFSPDTGRFSRVAEVNGALFGGGAGRRVPVRHIAEDARGRLWLGTSDGLAVRPAVTGLWRGFTPATDGLPSTHTNVVYADRAGSVWVGTDGGLCRFAPGPLGEVRALDCFRHIPGEPASLGADIVWTVTEDAEGRLWAGTIGGGLARFDAETEAWTRVTTADGLPNNTVYGLLADDDGRLWMTTNAGLAAYDTSTGDVTVYTAADGLPSAEFDFMAYHRGRDGTMYVGGPHGLAVFHPDRLAPTGEIAPVVVSGVAIGGERRLGLLDGGDRVVVAPGEDLVRFEFASLDFRNPVQNRYQYRLRGFETAWREADGQQPFAQYARVPPGEYVFQVRGANRDGVFNPETVEVAVSVLPLWWQSWWAQGLLALTGLGALGALAARLHTGRLRRERLAHLRRQRRIAHGLHTGPVPALRRASEDLDALASGDEAHPARAVRTAVAGVADHLAGVVEELGPPDWDGPPEASGEGSAEALYLPGPSSSGAARRTRK